MRLVMVSLEYMKDGSLGDVLFKQKRQLSESEVFCYARDVAAAMAYLHSLEPKIVHRDLKADNILVCSPSFSLSLSLSLARSFTHSHSFTLTLSVLYFSGSLFL
jgi:serine/threonine protein kinase